jgi:hypothetical protein
LVRGVGQGKQGIIHRQPPAVRAVHYISGALP